MVAHILFVEITRRPTANGFAAISPTMASNDHTWRVSPCPDLWKKVQGSTWARARAKRTSYVWIFQLTALVLINNPNIKLRPDLKQHRRREDLRQS